MIDTGRVWPFKRFSRVLDELAARHGLRRVGDARRQRFTLAAEIDGHAVTLTQDAVWIGRNPGPFPLLRVAVPYAITSYWLFLQAHDGGWRLTTGGGESRQVAPEDVPQAGAVVAALDALAAELRKLPVPVHVQLNVDPHGIVLSLLGGPASSDVWPAALAVMRAALPFAAVADSAG
jgi:hypothetical protein